MKVGILLSAVSIYFPAIIFLCEGKSLLNDLPASRKPFVRKHDSTTTANPFFRPTTTLTKQGRNEDGISSLTSLIGGDIPDQRTETITFRQDRRGTLSWALNGLWLITVGWSMFATWFVIGVALCCTIVGFPAGYQALKIAFFLVLPFGKSLTYTTKSTSGNLANFLLNLLWAVTVGWVLALQAIVSGIFLMGTIWGIPLGWQCFKLSYLAFRPFGIDYSAVEETTHQVVRPPTTGPPIP